MPEHIAEQGFASWVWQKLANGAALVGQPILRLSDHLDERAFRAAKRREWKIE